MSGDPIVIIATEDSDVARFVDAISRLPNNLPDWVLIGGVAVVLRVGGTHRATVDIDRKTKRLYVSRHREIAEGTALNIGYGKRMFGILGKPSRL